VVEVEGIPRSCQDGGGAVGSRPSVVSSMSVAFAKQFLHSMGLKSNWEDVKIGDAVQHPENGLVTITGGQYWGEYGVSNFWYWEDASGVEHHGYGWELK
jgi:hypothetical protein